MNTKRKTLKMPVRYLMNTVLVALLFLGLSYLTGNLLSTYQNKVLMTVGINIILAVSLNVATGYLGQLPLGHAGFMAVGAYACALFTKSSGLPKGVAFAIGLVLACIVAGLFGILIGIPALRLTGDYLAILTLGFGEIIRITLNNIDDVLGFKLFYGAKGLKNIPKYSNYWNVFLCVVIACFAIHAMMKSRHGRAILAVRDNEIAARSVGIPITKYKLMAFVTSAVFAGVAGVLYALNYSSLVAKKFDYNTSILILVFVVLGGIGNLRGSVIAAAVLTVLPELLRSMNDYRMLIYAIVLIVVMIFNQSPQMIAMRKRLTARFRKDAAGKQILVVCNFNPVLREGYTLGAPVAGTYKEILNSDDEAFGGSGAVCHALGRVVGVAAGRTARLRQGIVPGGVHLAHPRAFQMVLAFVGRHTDEPLLVILRLAPVYGRKRGEEGVLSQILGGVGLVHKLQADRVDELLVLLHQTGKFFICQFPHLLSL